MSDGSASGDDRTAALAQELGLARREIKWVRTELEHLTEALQRVRRQRARLREQSESLATGLAVELSAAYWREQESGLGRLRSKAGRRSDEAQLVREVEASEHFDAGWYLRQAQREILDQRIPPALHHVRHANRLRLDPSEDFSTGRYLNRHPEAADSGLPALLHAQREGRLADGLVEVSSGAGSDD
ncbi:hypothetical protein [Nocardioides currus]|uniref:Uncharacterized protein n=1 Tax=Nocardioides currus TaxID=2133958 RepID=A0A2R7YX12_9ACTN|nr:hypothetical protein [Nocardioides currus]PUA80908.1 hypothetical protein C7S10_10925 [Nocardioides currus]